MDSISFVNMILLCWNVKLYSSNLTLHLHHYYWYPFHLLEWFIAIRKFRLINWFITTRTLLAEGLDFWLFLYYNVIVPRSLVLFYMKSHENYRVHRGSAQEYRVITAKVRGNDEWSTGAIVTRTRIWNKRLYTYNIFLMGYKLNICNIAFIFEHLK